MLRTYDRSTMGEHVLVRRYDSVDGFRAVAEPYLTRREAEHCLALGILSSLAAGEWRNPFLATVDVEGKTALVALRTPPHRLVVSHVAEGIEPGVALDALVRVLDADVPGVVGDVSVAEGVARRWCARHPQVWRTAMAERIYRCDRVEPVPAVAGRMRPVASHERELIRRWLTAFMAEALPGEPLDSNVQVERFMTSPTRRMWAWERAGVEVGSEAGAEGGVGAGGAVSITGATGPTPNGIRIGPVYTPPELRRHGYATALVAAVTQLLLDEGRRFCFLFTDLANPTSNAIYQRIGYRPVSDASAIDFLPAGG